MLPRMRPCLSILLLLGCDSGASEPTPPPPQTGFQPNAACARCHMQQLDEYTGSPMHYASVSPVFRAFERALHEVGDAPFGPDAAGEAKDFCRRCHAPVAALTGRLDEAFDPIEEAITCDFCHRVTEVELANMRLEASPDVAKLGPFADALANDFHTSVATPEPLQSPLFCGSCHDVRIPKPDLATGEDFSRLEDLFTEWATSPWADPEHPLNPLAGQPGIGALHDEAPGEQVTCQDCHMSLYPARRFDEVVPLSAFAGVAPEQLDRKAHKLYPIGLAAEVEDAPLRRVSVHRFGGASVPMIPFPAGDDRRESVHAAREAMLKAAVELDLEAEVEPGEAIEVRAWLENVGAGHNVPSGFSQEREVWVELKVRDAGRACEADADCADLLEPRRFVDDLPLQCRVADAALAPGLLRERRARMERSGRCAEGQCLVYRSGYLLDRDGDGRLADEDLRHALVDIDAEAFTERCTVPGPDADQRPSGIQQGLVIFSNTLQRVLDEPREGVEAIAPQEGPEFATQRARYERLRYRTAHPERGLTTLSPLEANRFFNGEALRPFEPRVARYTVPWREGLIGPLEIHARLRFRSFPPKVLRALAERSPELVDEALVDRLRIIDMAEARLERSLD